MAYTDIDKPSDYFNTVLYTGTGSDRTCNFNGNWIYSRFNLVEREDQQLITIFYNDSVRGKGSNGHYYNLT